MVSDDPLLPVMDLHLGDPRRRTLLVDGVVWAVYAYASPYDRRSRPDLIFESEVVVRRVRNYPEGWFHLPAEALFALSNGR